MKDLEKSLPEGYPSLARLMSQGAENSVFNRFREMGTRVLLYKQSNINALRRDLQKLDALDTHHRGEAGKIARRAAKDWRLYSTDSSDMVARRRQLMSQIETELESYHQFLLLQSDVAQLRRPPRHSLMALRDWYTAREPKILEGVDTELYDDLDDLVAFNPTDEDRHTLGLRRTIGWMFSHKVLDQVNGKVLLRSTTDGALHVAANIVGVLLSIVLILGPTILLIAFAGHEMWVKLLIVGLFIVAFTVVVGLLTQARRAELFAGVAAYGAVLVVFLSSTTTSIAPPGG